MIETNLYRDHFQNFKRHNIPKFNKCQIAKKLNVRDTTIHKIIKNERWKHLTP